MVKHERDGSRSPVASKRKRRGKDGSPADQSPHHRQPQSAEQSPGRDSHRRSRSPDSHGHKRKHHSHRHKEKRRGHREEHRPDENEEVTFDPHRRIKEEPSESDSNREQQPQQRHNPQHRVKEEPSDSSRDQHQRRRDHHHHHHRRTKEEPSDNFREQQRERRQNDDRRREVRQQREQEDGGVNFGGPSGNEAEEEGSSAPDKEKPNFELSGKLTEDTNTFRGVVVKYNEPAEARKPKRRWRLYGFKGEEALPMLPIHRQSAYLLGRDRRVADIPVDHPSCSKQHAVLQYRLTDFTRPDGSQGRKVRPYIIDLGSANGTFINNKQIDGQRYIELFERDLIKFGFSSREYVLLHENVDTSEVADQSDTD